MVSILGIDPSTKTGIAVFNYGKGEISTESTELKFPKLKGIHRVCAFSDEIINILEKVKPTQIVIENYGFSNAHTLVTLVEVGTAIRMACHLAGYSYLEVPPTSLKKFVTGTGNAKKDQMALHLYKYFGMEGKNDNEVDAIGLALFGAYAYGHLSTDNLTVGRADAIKGVMG